MLDLHKKLAESVVVTTTAVMFLGVVKLAPLVSSETYPKQAGALVAAALTSFGVYKLFSTLLLNAFKTSQPLRKLLLGDRFLEGTWVGHYRHNDLDRFTLEIISQADGDTRIDGREFDENGDTRAMWSSESAYIDVRHQSLKYFYSCDVVRTNHQQIGIGVFKLVKSD